MMNNGFFAGGFFLPMPDDWQPTPLELAIAQARTEALIEAPFGETRAYERLEALLEERRRVGQKSSDESLDSRGGRRGDEPR
jgi:hypothetical protein